ncbi:MAG: acyl-CoA dehydrogenase family protein, partial [Actinomycetota bacterium]|nr:acyl-CoA dehydrogenase family protein [Actinomycetota bacterium]
LLAAAATAAEVAAAHADDAETARRLPRVTVDALIAGGLMRLCVPAAYDGPDADPMTLVEAIETVAAADGAAGWCATIASTTSSMAVFLDAAAAKELYGDPGIVTGGVFAPNGEGHVDGDTVTVTGRWQWGSGTQHCRWVLGGVRCDDGTFRLCWFAAADVTFHDTWYTSGLRGTGSLDFSVDGAVVPLARTVQPGVSRPTMDIPLAAFPNFALLAAGIAAVSLGIGRHALDELVALAEGKRPLFSSRSLAESPFTQIELARATARLRSARAYLLDELAAAWALANERGRIDVATRAAIRLASVNATESAVAATDAAYTLAGGSSVYSSNVLQRCLRDVHMTTQHLMVAPKLHETLGRLLLGLEANTQNL